jgi:hypothetical protein
MCVNFFVFTLKIIIKIILRTIEELTAITEK